jgi:hypothetical protein
MMDLIEECKNHDIKDILELEDIKERVDLCFELEAAFKE